MSWTIQEGEALGYSFRKLYLNQLKAGFKRGTLRGSLLLQKRVGYMTGQEVGVPGESHQRKGGQEDNGNLASFIRK
jgi:hypothetical protein